MPPRLASPCPRPGCRGILRAGVCDHCGHTRRRLPEPVVDDRPSAAKRGYGRTWRKLRRMILDAAPLCVDCQRAGRTVLATDVDHIIPKRHGGDDSFANLQPLCHSCHSKKTNQEPA